VLSRYVNKGEYNMKYDRRQFLKMAGVSSALLAGGGISSLLAGCARIGVEGAGIASAVPTILPSPTTTRPIVSGSFSPDVELSLTAEPGKVDLFSGAETRVWRYMGEVLDGDPAALQTIPGSYLGPTIRARRGQKMRVHLTNKLDEQTIIHWHGLHVPEAADGHPRLAISPGETYTYEFEVMNRAGTYWYHPHPHGRTGPQVYNGLAGLFIVSDDEEQSVGLPDGEYDVPIVIQDRLFDNSNQLRYLSGGMMDTMMGMLGNRILVNGFPDHVMSAARRPYRLRILNGSNARMYAIKWEDNSPLQIIGTDGGLLESPVERDYLILGPAQRIELWVDFSRYDLGTEIQLQSLPVFNGSMGGGMGMGGMGQGSSRMIDDGPAYTLLQIHIDQDSDVRGELPKTLSNIVPLNTADSVNAANPKQFSLNMQHGSFTINGRAFEMESVSVDERIQLGTQETWQFINQGGMGMMMESMAHPMHLHHLQFQVLDRQGDNSLLADYDAVREGILDEGWRDVVLVLPGEKVTIAMRFDDFTGLFLYHCHILEHEDAGMMRNFRVEG
jgi:blue copper oxidase